jgi:BlaI family transcriptional regulator, penicillinase repressor
MTAREIGATPPILHELESEVMDRVWRLGETTVHAVHDELNARSEKQRAYTTVMTVMSRLCAKGVLERERRGRRDYYVATISRSDYLDARAGLEVDTLVAAYGDLALVHFADHMARLDPDRRARLHRLARRG